MVSETIKLLNTIFAGILAIFYSIFHVFLPYVAAQNPAITLAELEAQTLATPFVGVLFEPFVMFAIIFILWIYSLVIALEKESRQIKGSI